MKLTKVIAIVLSIFLPSISFAQAATTYPNVTSFTTIPDFLAAVLQGALLVGTPIVVIFIIYAGFLFVTANGDEKQLSTAKSALLWACIGAVVLLGAEIFAQAIADTVDSLK